MSEDTQPTMTYPTKQQHARWKARAEDFDTSLSKWIQAMVEAGDKKFEIEVEPDETNDELREQRDDLRAELDHARERNERLEGMLYDEERAAVVEHLAEEGPAPFEDALAHVRDTAPARVSHHLTELEAEGIVEEVTGVTHHRGGWHLTGEGADRYPVIADRPIDAEGRP